MDRASTQSENLLETETGPDLKWGTFIGQFALAVVAIICGTLAGLLAEDGHGIGWVIGLVAIGVALMIWLIAPRRNDDEFDRSISMQAGTFAGISTVIFVVIDQLHFHVSADSVLQILALPGFYLMQWLIMSQYLRWRFAQGDDA